MFARNPLVWAIALSLGVGLLPAPSVQARTMPAISHPASVPPVTFTVLGDSNTAAKTTTLDEGLASGSWVASAESSHHILVGGWALSGANSKLMNANARRWGASVLVIMIGTNDIAGGPRGMSWNATKANIIAAVHKVGPHKVILSAVAPLTVAGHPVLSKNELQYNAHLKSLAALKHWTFTDPWKSFRNSHGGWLRASDTQDGVHGTAATWKTVGARLGIVI